MMPLRSPAPTSMPAPGRMNMMAAPAGGMMGGGGPSIAPPKPGGMNALAAIAPQGGWYPGKNHPLWYQNQMENRMQTQQMGAENALQALLAQGGGPANAQAPRMMGFQGLARPMMGRPSY